MPTMSHSDDEDDFLSADEGLDTTNEELDRSKRIVKTIDKTNVQDNEDEDDEIITERIRERNLKIARKFSAEIAKNVKASAPIPVNNTKAERFKVSDSEYPGIPADTDLKNSSLPPAPPPTPALSSSFNSDEQWSPSAASAAATTAANASSSSSASASQYGWRLPNKVKMTSATNNESSTSTDATSELARQTLDRLSEKLAQSDKNLFEKVAEDLKKVTISVRRSNEASSSTANATTSDSTIPIISDIGSTLSNLNWDSASKFLFFK